MPHIILIQNDYSDAASLSKILNYAMSSGVADGYALDPNCAYREMRMIKSAFHKEDGNQLVHFVISFSNEELYRIDEDEILNLGFQVGRLFGQYQLAYGLHFNTRHLHVHFVLNCVSFIDGRRYSGGLFYFWRLKRELQTWFPRSDIGIYRSFPGSDCNTFSDSIEDYLLRIG